MDRVDEWHIKEKKNSRKGLITSMVIHGLLLLLLVLLTTSLKQPEDQIQGVLIDFGNSKTGSGESVQPQKIDEVVEEVQPQEVQPAAPSEASQSTPSVADEVITQDHEEAPSITPEDKPSPEEIAAAQAAAEQAAAEQAAAEQAAAQAAAEAAAQAAAEQEAQDLKDQLDQAWNTGDGSEGESTPGGDQGVQDGVDNGPHNDGNSSTGLGDDGIGYDLGGRRMVKKPTITDTSQKTGRVAVQVKVDRNGSVVYAKYTSRGSNTTDSYLIRLAEQAARQAKFNSDVNAASEQIGTITFTFKLQ